MSLPGFDFFAREERAVSVEREVADAKEMKRNLGNRDWRVLFDWPVLSSPRSRLGIYQSLSDSYIAYIIVTFTCVEYNYGF
jgi:hypothetical protein